MTDIKTEDLNDRTSDENRTYLGSEFVKCDYCGTEIIIGKHLEGDTIECKICALTFNFKK